ncbi:hypothetical protein FJTKL_08497 [Diaporthe vaccinii]|uniref:NAD(P)-binding domain-containing protein n=1 Tax=Diaporthe vaccinii TaxID=105482 RepID=A0ABR4ER79_9PEZI
MIMVPFLWSGYYMSSACLPDGTFSIYEIYDPWDIYGFFQITSGFGELTFTQAKVVDVVWDVAVGRIGQTILVVFSWRAFSLHIKASLEEGPDTRNISYHTYWTIFMQDSISILGVVGVIRDFLARRRLRSIAAMVFMTVTMLFVLAWPTVASAMTGYDSNNVAFIKIRDGSLIPFSSFSPLLYIIHDGSRVDGLTDEYLVPCCSETREWDPTFISKGNAYCYCYSTTDKFYTLGNNVSLYAETYGLLGLNNTNSTWPEDNTSLPSPALNISAFPTSRYDTYGSEWTDPRTGQQPFMDEKKITYVYNNEAYDFDYIITQGYGRCQPNGTYKWGFSFLQAFIAMLLMSLWSLSVYVMWLKAHLKLSSRGPYEIPNRYKAAVKLTRAIAVDFGDVDQATALSNKEFSTHVSRNLRGGRVGGDPAMALGKYSFRSGLKGWVAKEKRWFSGMVLCTLLLRLNITTFNANTHSSSGPTDLIHTKQHRRITMSKHVLVLGGHGKISQLLTPILLKKSWTVTSIIRTEEQIPAIKKLGESLQGKLNVLVRSIEEVKSESQAKSILDEVNPDYVFWSAGAGGRGGAERTFAVDRDAAIHFIKASANTPSITRFLNISYLDSRRNKPSWWNDDDWKAAEEVNHRILPNYYIAKLAADEALYQESARRGSDFVGINLRPGTLSTEPAGKVELGKTKTSRGKVSRESVAQVSAALLGAEGVRNSWIDLLDGDEEVGAAVQRVVRDGVDAAEEDPVYKL